MVYTSKRRKFKDFVRTKNWHYYIIFLLIFATLVTSVIIITRKNNANKNNNTSNAIETPSNSLADDSNDIISNVKGRYKLCVNTAIYQLTIFEWDEESNSYKDEAYKYMPIAYDQDIQSGTYSFTEASISKDTWYTTSDGKNYRYITNFNNEISFHSAEFSSYNDKNSLVKESYELIGYAKSTDGFLLLCSDAKWIYENCSYASEVVIYSDDSESISENITQLINLAPGLLWEPTDISSASPYCSSKISEIKCLYDNITVTPGTDITYLYKYVKATDENNNNVNSYIYTTSSGTLNDVRTYSIMFFIADIYGNVLSDNLIVDVVIPEPPTEEEIEEETTQIEDSSSTDSETSSDSEITETTESIPSESTSEESTSNNETLIEESNEL